MRFPPGVPSARNGLPARSAIVGAMLDRTRLPGSIEFTLSGTGSIKLMWLSRSIPVPGVVTFEPKALCNVCVVLTIVPSASTTVQCVVLEPSPPMKRATPANWPAEADDVVADREPPQQIEHLYDVRPARGRRRGREDLVAAILSANGGPLVHPVIRQVFQCYQTAVGLHVRDHRVRERARVHRFGALVGNLPQRAGIVSSDDQLADAGWTARRQEHFGRGREASDGGSRVADHVDQVTAGGEASCREPDGWLEQPGEWEPAIPLHRVRPALQRTRSGNRAVADTIHFVYGLVIEATRHRLIHVLGDGAWHGRVVVDERDVTSAPVANEEESGAERREHHWLDDRQSKQCRYRRVDRVAARTKHFSACRRSERMVRRDDGLRGDHLTFVGLLPRLWPRDLSRSVGQCRATASHVGSPVEKTCMRPCLPVDRPAI